MYSCSSTLSQIYRKKSLGKWFFKVTIFAKQKLVFGRHFETVQSFKYFFFCWNMVIISVCIWCENNFKIPVGKWFSEGDPWNPLRANGKWEYLMQLSVKGTI